MSNEARYNRAFHVRAKGRVSALLGDVKPTKGDIPCRSVIITIPQRKCADNPTGEDWNIACLIYGAAALCQVGDNLDCCGSVVDYGTRLEGNDVKPKLVFAANAHCQLNPPEGGDGLYVALAGRIAYVGKTEKVCGMMELQVGVAIADFPAMVGIILRGENIITANKHDLLLTEGDVVQFGLSNDGKRPALRAVAIKGRVAFTTNPFEKEKKQ